MRIALINNMNNNFFAIARYLRDAGVDAHLYTLPDSFTHFQPSADTFMDVGKLDWLHQLPLGENLRDFLNLGNVDYSELKTYDILVGCGIVPAFLARKGVQIDVFIPFGWDLMHGPFPKWDSRHPCISLIDQWRGFWLRRAFKNSRFVVINDTHKLYRDPAKRLGLECVNLPIPAVYNQEEYTINGNSELVEHDFIVFYHGRQLWASNPDNLSDFAVHGGNKRNDKVIRAFARFVRKTSFKSPVLIMFEYGPDVDASKELIEEEGIANNVLWRPISTRKEIMRELSQADIATEYFRPNGCGLGGTGLEAMACGVPLLTHTNGASIDPGHHLYNIPIVDVLEAEEIYSTFVDYEKNPGKYRELGDAAREWYDRKHGKGSISRYMNLFNKIIADRDNTLSKES